MHRVNVHIDCKLKWAQAWHNKLIKRWELQTVIWTVQAWVGIKTIGQYVQCFCAHAKSFPHALTQQRFMGRADRKNWLYTHNSSVLAEKGNLGCFSYSLLWIQQIPHGQDMGADYTASLYKLGIQDSWQSRKYSLKEKTAVKDRWISEGKGRDGLVGREKLSAFFPEGVQCMQ